MEVLLNGSAKGHAIAPNKSPTGRTRLGITNGEGKKE